MKKYQIASLLVALSLLGGFFVVKAAPSFNILGNYAGVGVNSTTTANANFTVSSSLAIAGLASAGSPCLIVSSTGLVSTSTCVSVLSSSTIWGLFSNTATGLTYTNTNGITALTLGYFIPFTASGTQWNAAFASSSLITSALGTAAFRPLTDFIASSTTFVATTTINGVSGPTFTLTSTTYLGITNVGSNFTLTNLGVTSTIGNWIGTWQGVNSTTFLTSVSTTIPTIYVSTLNYLSGAVIATGTANQILVSTNTMQLVFSISPGFPSSTIPALPISIANGGRATGSTPGTNYLMYFNGTSITGTSTIFISTSTWVINASGTIIQITNGGGSSTIGVSTRPTFDWVGVKGIVSSTVSSADASGLISYSTLKSTNGISLVPFGTSATWPSATTGDSVLTWNTDTNSTSGLVIAPYNGLSSGLRIASSGKITAFSDLMDASGNKYVTSTTAGSGSVTTSSAITVNHFPFWTSTNGALSGTSTLTLFGTTLNNSGTIAVNGTAVLTSVSTTIATKVSQLANDSGFGSSTTGGGNVNATGTLNQIPIFISTSSLLGFTGLTFVSSTYALTIGGAASSTIYGGTGATSLIGGNLSIASDLTVGNNLEIKGNVSSTAIATTTASFGVTFDGGGSVIASNASSSPFCISFNGTIRGWRVTTDLSCTVAFDVWKASKAIPTVANRIAGTETPSSTSAQLSSSTALTGWTIALTAGDCLMVVVTSTPSGCTKASLGIDYSKQ